MSPRTDSGKMLMGPVNRIAGTVDLPTSKSITNRALIMSAVANGGTVENPLRCDDTELLANAIQSCGWPIAWDDDIRISRRTPAPGRVQLNLGNSGTGSRLLLALLAVTPGEFVIDGTARLRQRPVKPLLDALRDLGARIAEGSDCFPVRVHGDRLPGGTVKMRPGTSSQYVTALLLTAPLMASGLNLELEGEVPSRPYLDLTVDILRLFGAVVDRDRTGRRWRVEPGGVVPTSVQIESDWSAAAFFFAAVAVAGGEVTLPGLSRHSAQGDARICGVLGDSGIEVHSRADALRVRGPITSPIFGDLSDTPDLFPALAVVAACGPKGSRLSGLQNLKHKESDRLAVMVENLQRLGARFDAAEDTLTVRRSLDRGASNGTTVRAADDHRIAMAMAVAALAAGPVVLDDPECVAKSFPEFWTVWDRLCG